MQRKIIGWLLFLLLLNLLACNSKVSYKDAVSEKINQQFSSEQLFKFDYIVLIPNSGCTGCISQAEDYFLMSNKEERILFIFTDILSKKDLSIRLGKESLNQTNVWCDYENTVYFSDYQESLYPCVIHLSNGKIIKFSDLDELLV